MGQGPMPLECFGVRMTVRLGSTSREDIMSHVSDLVRQSRASTHDSRMRGRRFGREWGPHALGASKMGLPESIR